MGSRWTVGDYYARIRNSQLKPTNIPNVYSDPEGEHWYVDDPNTMTPEEREESFNRLQARRGRQ